MHDKKIKVLYIAGEGRSGSTILSNILGGGAGFFSAGELMYIWERGLMEKRLCACGAPPSECEVWNPILSKAFGSADHIEDQSEVHLHSRQKGARMRFLPMMLCPGGRSLLKWRLKSYLDSLTQLYHAIHDVTKCKVIIDSSKSPAYAYALSMIPTIDLFVVHLVRDSRANAYSWMRQKRFEPGQGKPLYLQRYGYVRSSLLWNLWNWATQTIMRRYAQEYMTVRYEDFVDNPPRTVQQISAMVGEKLSHFPFVTPHKVDLGVNHTVMGNPNRFQSGVVELIPDDEWQDKLKPIAKAVITAITLPLLRQYGYRLY